MEQGLGFAETRDRWMQRPREWSSKFGAGRQGGKVVLHVEGGTGNKYLLGPNPFSPSHRTLSLTRPFEPRRETCL
jgi:hypothetical protein